MYTSIKQDFTILVTGASGYIGSSVVKALLPTQVVATARRPTAALATDLGVPVLELDVLHTHSFDTHRKISAVIHCATANDILSADFTAGVDLSVNGTWRMLELAHRLGAEHFIFLSTFQVYGTELSGRITEETSVRCETPYALNHFLGEETCRMFSRTRGLRVSILRPANIFGVPDASTVNRMSLVPMCFVKEALLTGRLLLRSSGQQKRNFISVTEVAEACVQAAIHPSSDLFAVHNICSDWLVSIRDIADITCEVYREIFGKPLPLEVASDLPLASSGFNATSNLLRSQGDPDRSRNCMRLTITRLFNKMSGSSHPID